MPAAASTAKMAGTDSPIKAVNPSAAKAAADLFGHAGEATTSDGKQGEREGEVERVDRVRREVEVTDGGGSSPLVIAPAIWPSHSRANRTTTTMRKAPATRRDRRIRRPVRASPGRAEAGEHERPRRESEDRDMDRRQRTMTTENAKSRRSTTDSPVRRARRVARPPIPIEPATDSVRGRARRPPGSRDQRLGPRGPSPQCPDKARHEEAGGGRDRREHERDESETAAT